MTYIPKPTSREGILFFGDGDEASFISCGPSVMEGFNFFKYKPTPQMRWKKQIQQEEYDLDDNTLNRIYKKDLCIQLSFDPDFPMWLILCDYRGKEDTPLMDNFVRLRQFIQRNRDLEHENMILLATVSRFRKQARRKAEHPTEDEYDKLSFLQRVNEGKQQPMMMPPPLEHLPGES